MYPDPNYRPIKPGSGTCPACEGAKGWDPKTGIPRWTEPKPDGTVKCPLCGGTGVYTYKGV